MIYIWSAISLGLVSNFHCLGMCGPIALAIPVKSHSFSARLGSILVYNAGRITTYALIGAIFGIFGQSIALAGFQQQLSLVLGALIIIMAVGILIDKKTHFLSKMLPSKAMVLQQKMGNYLRKQGYMNNFILGILNGMLPCGVIYIAVLGAVATGNILHGMAFMAFFGLGTLPVMILMPWIKDLLSIKFRASLQKSVPIFLLIFGGILFVRGANLGIPYLSPKVIESKVNSDNNLESDSCVKSDIPRMECCQSGSNKDH
ncbi:MAG: sulfite exporter TauE/SafE family protein [Flavobacteriales bacterium]|nr:sulfite exporter TauE/SafE family protein [Flavobacteriales bacterium]MCB9198292.1 sulfite exporter TauE/SafE family protein [Flavobacteriales bacterium]